MKSILHIPAIAGRTHLGCSEKEREKAQNVEVDLLLKFERVPPACETDSIESTPCYKEMSEILTKVFKKKHYATIEHLCLHCMNDIEAYLKDFSWVEGSKLSITLKKLKPPVTIIEQGSHFTLQKRL